MMTRRLFVSLLPAPVAGLFGVGLTEKKKDELLTSFTCTLGNMLVPCRKTGSLFYFYSGVGAKIEHWRRSDGRIEVVTILETDDRTCRTKSTNLFPDYPEYGTFKDGAFVAAPFDALTYGDLDQWHVQVIRFRPSDPPATKVGEWGLILHGKEHHDIRPINGSVPIIPSYLIWPYKVRVFHKDNYKSPLYGKSSTQDT